MMQELHPTASQALPPSPSVPACCTAAAAHLALDDQPAVLVAHVLLALRQGDGLGCHCVGAV